VYRAYWEFAARRQQIYERRLAGESAPWTEDEILRQYRFCNVFRASDRVSQYLIQRVIYSEVTLKPQDRFLRTVLFRLFSRPETWELIEARTGIVRIETFDSSEVGSVLDDAFASGTKLYTSAFILCANRAYGHNRKHRNHLALVDAMLSDHAPERTFEASSLEEVYGLLKGYPLIGPFMAYQLAIDLNYGPDLGFSEDDFTMPGPGALRGLKKVFEHLGDYTVQEAVHWLVEQQEEICDQLDVSAPLLAGKRRLHAIDCQNLLCEVDKYARIRFPHLKSDRHRIKQNFVPAGELPRPFFPPSWGLRRWVARDSSQNFSAV
jgi:hypothetical protein